MLEISTVEKEVDPRILNKLKDIGFHPIDVYEQVSTALRRASESPDPETLNIDFKRKDFGWGKGADCW